MFYLISVSTHIIQTSNPLPQQSSILFIELKIPQPPSKQIICCVENILTVHGEKETDGTGEGLCKLSKWLKAFRLTDCDIILNTIRFSPTCSKDWFIVYKQASKPRHCPPLTLSPRETDSVSIAPPVGTQAWPIHST